METAFEFGFKHGSTISEYRLGYDRMYPGEGQPGFYRDIQNGSYLMWQLRQTDKNILVSLIPKMFEVIELSTERVGRASKYEALAKGMNLSTETCKEIAKFINYACSDLEYFSNDGDEEDKLQAHDIHRLIPEWPGD